MAEHRAITFRKPVEFAGETFREIVLEEPTVGQFRQLEGMKRAEAAVFFVFLVGGMPIAAIEMLGARDFRAASEYLWGFCAGAKRIADPLDECKITLKTPVTDDEGTIFDLALSEPTAGDLKAADQLLGASEMLTLISLRTGLPVERLRNLRMRDFRAAEGYLLGFF